MILAHLKYALPTINKEFSIKGPAQSIWKNSHAWFSHSQECIGAVAELVLQQEALFIYLLKHGMIYFIHFSKRIIQDSYSIQLLLTLTTQTKHIIIQQSYSSRVWLNLFTELQLLPSKSFRLLWSSGRLWNASKS